MKMVYEDATSGLTPVYGSNQETQLCPQVNTWNAITYCKDKKNNKRSFFSIKQNQSKSIHVIYIWPEERLHPEVPEGNHEWGCTVWTSSWLLFCWKFNINQDEWNGMRGESWKPSGTVDISKLLETILFYNDILSFFFWIQAAEKEVKRDHQMLKLCFL